MKRLILHFGTHKTGSTSIQRNLATADLGPKWEYAKLGVNQGGVVSAAFTQDLFSIREYKLFGIDRGELLKIKMKSLELFKSALKSCKKDNLIVSGERIVKLEENDLSELNRVSSSLGFKVEAIGYLREPKSRMEAVFQQKIKFPYKYTSLEDLFYPDYQKKLIKFENVLGKDNVLFLLYDRKNLLEKCVVKDFCFRLGIKTDAWEIHRYNESIPLRALRFLYTYKKFGLLSTKESNHKKQYNRLIRRLKDLKGPKMSFSLKIVNPIIEEKQQVIDWINSRLNVPFPYPTCTDNLPGCVYCEEDFFNFDRESIDWLANLVNKSPDEYIGDPSQIASWVHLLYQQVE
ncbi:hypothetical protein [Candidatus Uabimicrobium amorphum]|uniref:Sulfotransferase domain-containing protein n=1 Tax=Uabimicrobium amorphum TaxID=2596890 RepID=A0A5S9F636_UABAM|nr:hypothetical protein [Candidatus Uabimicrobium amorphum]BBM87487.1 hypothetical protein UABAM_05899 [Candidatus Uabimicrobium amorphum]